MREKLIELIGQVQDDGCDYTECFSKWDRPNHIENSVLADHLIVNGVTIQKWIPIKEFPLDKEGWYLTCDHKGNRHTMYHHDTYEVPFCIYENHARYYPPKWFMPLSEPPKED